MSVAAVITTGNLDEGKARVTAALAVLAAAEEETEGIRGKEEFFLPG